mmetsp:Transcript_26492/g.90408  ORF Transcript_26492/g.90408 Transcript_26492/m.90408 type:complete len:246 (-) Transcript_26492:21-758(-)
MAGPSMTSTQRPQTPPRCASVTAPQPSAMCIVSGPPASRASPAIARCMAAAQADARMTACASPPARPLSSSLSAQRQRIVSASPENWTTSPPYDSTRSMSTPKKSLRMPVRETVRARRFAHREARRVREEDRALSLTEAFRRVARRDVLAHELGHETPEQAARLHALDLAAPPELLGEGPVRLEDDLAQGEDLGVRREGTLAYPGGDHRPCASPAPVVGCGGGLHDGAQIVWSSRLWRSARDARG